MALIKKSIIPAVTIGSILEWYEMGLYVYWASVIEKMFFDYALPATETINAMLVICTGLIARPLGGFIYGRLGDKKGRKKAFTSTIIFISLPTFLIGITQSYSQWSLFSTIFLGLMKFIQGIPAGGEVPGAICYLAENSIAEKKWYTCSFAFVGPQIGLLLSLAECLLLQQFLPERILISWGWRLSFLTCGMLGILGYFLRKKLHESREYEHLQHTSSVATHPIKELFKSNKKATFLGFSVSIFEVVSFCLLTIVPVFYFKQVFNLSDSQNLLISSVSLCICAVLPPLIGKIADRYTKLPLLEISALAFIFLAYPFYFSISKKLLVSTITLQTILIFFFSIQVALLPRVLSDLFPVQIRYTGIGFSFNICDGILWGLVPILSVWIIQKTHEVASFAVFLPITALIFLASYFQIKKLKKQSKDFLF